MSVFLIGIDAGGTKTVCQLAARDGAILAEARGDGANLQAAGELAVEKTLHGLLAEVLGGRDEAPAVICVGMSGVDRHGDTAVVQGILERIGRGARTLIVNDALIALEAGAPAAPGVVLIAGTGSIAYGRDAGGRAARAGGWGYVLGDEGSGYWIGRQALRAVVRETDRRGVPTSLTPRALAHFGVERPQELIREIYAGGVRPSAIAAFASEVQAAFDEGDQSAVVILEAAVRELQLSAGSVVSQLGLARAAFHFVLAGGMFRAVPWMAAQLQERLPRLAPRATVERLAVEPATGAVHLARALLTGSLQLPRYDL
ncbi:MAG: N-acetylglucosamine kinase [Vicinamibacteria bacterium]